jgi:glucosamine--fructose-6-phosphate aminotransferase (isomerizing)
MEKNYMLEQIKSLPALLEQIVEPLDISIREKIDHELCLSVKRIFTVGCGDSHHAALGTELAFEKLTGLSAEPMNSMLFSRYAAGFIPKSGPKTNLMVGISVSGSVSRTAESIRMAKQAGATTAALTANPDSPVGKEAEILLDVPVPSFPDPEGVIVPGVRSYVTSQVGLLLLAIRIAEVNGKIKTNEANQYRKDLNSFSESLEKTISVCLPVAEKAAKEWKDATNFVFAGSGPNYASSLFSAAKILEASGDPALGQDVEEWAHLQYFAKEANTPTFIITAGDRDLSRAEEMAVAAKQLGRRIAVVAPKTAVKLIANADFYFPTPSINEMFSPLITSVPGELFAAYRAEVINEPFFRDFTGGRSIEGGGGISRIRTSETWENWKP